MDWAQKSFWEEKRLKREVLISILLIIIPLSNIMGFENNIGGKTTNAGMGFTKVIENLSFLSDLSYAPKSMVSFANTDLYGAGLVYNDAEAVFRLKSSLDLRFRYESMVDKDRIDNSGYSQRLGAVGLIMGLTDFFRIGMDFSKLGFRLHDQAIGNGYELNMGALYGPLSFADFNMLLGVKIDRLASLRRYETNREEVSKPDINYGINIAKNNFQYAMDFKSGDFRCGVEYYIMPYVALRAGMSNGQPTLGLGILRKPFSIDYAFWLSDIGATHRIGSSVNF